MGLWDRIILNKEKKALEYMVKYCNQDVALLEKVYKELKKQTEPKMHYGVIFGQDRSSCPECGSDDLIRNNKVVTATGLTRIQYKCKTCNKFHSKTDK
jgi:transposase-like protein